MAHKPAKLNFKDLTAYRKSKGLNQSEFWTKFGATQSGGSRYETGRELPKQTAMLIWLLESGRITDKDLADALKAVNKER